LRGDRINMSATRCTSHTVPCRERSDRSHVFTTRRCAVVRYLQLPCVQCPYLSVRPSVCVLSDTIRCYRETAARITVQSTQMTEPIEMSFGLWEAPNSQGTMYKVGPDHPPTGRSTFGGHTYRFARSRYSQPCSLGAAAMRPLATGPL